LPLSNGPEGQEDMPWLLTAGPVVTSRDVKLAMLADWCNRDSEFISMLLQVTEQFLEIAQASELYDCIPLDVSGAGALESALGALSPTGRKRKTLVAAHGAFANQAVSILDHLKRPVEEIAGEPLQSVTIQQLSQALEGDEFIHTVYLCLTDPTTGIVNPVEELAEVAREAGCQVVLDARGGFGGLPVSLKAGTVDALVGVPEICLESVPGFSFVIVRRSLIDEALSPAPARALDLQGIWQRIHRTGRFTGMPSPHAVSACKVALRELFEEGGPRMRQQRYQRVHRALLAGMRRLGFRPAADETQPVSGYTTLFQRPGDPHYTLDQLAQKLRGNGYVIMDSEGCPGPQDSIRIATIGSIDETVVRQFLTTLTQCMREMGMRSGAPRRRG
jgi:2-aminoethylphosphonate-pyruvate transaminase